MGTPAAVTVTALSDTEIPEDKYIHQSPLRWGSLLLKGGNTRFT